MSTSMLIAVIAIAAVVVIALAVGLWMAARRRRLRNRFGPEYDRTIETEGGRKAAERELREERHDELEIKELRPERRDQYAVEWTSVQEHFVDRPEGSVKEADELVSRLMRERGYPTEDYRGQLRDLSVEHGRTLEHYRAAHDVKVRSTDHETTTEELRGAMVHYRALFDDLLTDQRSR
ncbi:hypothetical protein PV371_14645 [Streptomyces sp. TX20-6-3]|uniref:hypothetical protein n=1 Tax=Streptomyces sp. TX20-6-3 TaxID=3028705 RepID=UPI0029BCEDEC|nr:hypothetical protein [Streptomyces sp. TX20-6-3]MDX2560886.1 hypothetical protein [Streptomyces sp. TX20-6-3]